MKKRLFIILICMVLALSLTLAFVACDDTNPVEPGDPTDPSEPGEPVDPPMEIETYSITYNEVGGILYSENNPVSVKEGESFCFSFKVSVLYEGEPIVKVNDRERKSFTYDDETYLYTYTIANASRDMVVDILGVEACESELLSSGTGALETPFLIQKPVDLVKMAEVINAGAENSAMSVLGFYILEEDLDFHGEEIDIIGDGNNEHAFFGGYFNGNGHTISNFVINGKSDYVGLFGIVQAYDLLGFTGGTIYNLKISDFKVSATNSGSTVVCGSMLGQGFGASMVLCDAINGTVEIYGDANHFSYAGGLVGLQRAYQDPFYSKLSYCSTQNVSVNCLLGTTFCAGGISGYLYSESPTVNATITNCYSTGNVRGSFYAGGIAGWVSNYSSISNCYSTGIVNAQSNISDRDASEEYCHSYAGGLVGMAQNDSAVVDSFSASKVSSAAALGVNYSHTGDIVGRIEELNEELFGSRLASVYNCYYVGNQAENDPDFTNGDVVKEKLYWHEIDWILDEEGYPIVNSVNSSSDEGIQHYTYVITIDFGDAIVKDLNGESLTNIEISVTDQYESMSFWYTVYSTYLDGTGIPESLVAENGNISYGYYFDPECTLAVPCGFVATRNITLYAGFADYNDVAGTYYIETKANDAPESLTYVALTLYDDGTFACDDTFASHFGYYIYDGNEIIFYNARFARYFGDNDFANFMTYEFKGIIEDDGLSIYGAITYDESGNQSVLIPDATPLYAIKEGKALVGSYYVVLDGKTYIYTFNADGTGIEEKNYDEFEYSVNNGQLTISIDGEDIVGVVENGIPVSLDGKALKKTDSFKGTWEISSLAQKSYEFDGAGSWSYLYYGYIYDSERNTSSIDIISRASGKYVLDGDKAVLDNGVKAVISNGTLEIVSDNGSVSYASDKSSQGVWTSSNGSIQLVLNGISSSGDGEGIITFINDLNGRKKRAIYELVYSHNPLTADGIVLYYQGEIFGMLSFSRARFSLVGNIYSVNDGTYSSTELFHLDEYKGEWYALDSEPIFSIVSFNGYGVYTFNNNIPLNGKIVINGDEVEYTLNDYTLAGTFNYNGKIYSISYDEEACNISISYNDSLNSLVQADILGNKTFIDENGKTYQFDGKGALPSLGKLTIHDEVGVINMSYQIGGSDGQVATITDGTNVLGALTITTIDEERYYSLSVSDGDPIILTEKTVFTGKWALSGYYEDYVKIGGMSLDGTVKGYIPLSIDEELNVKESALKMVNDYLVWQVDEHNTVYMINIAENEFVLSRYLNWFDHESSETTSDGTDYIWNYSYAMLADALRGTWISDELSAQYEFDGMGKNPDVLGIYTKKNIYGIQDDQTETDGYYGIFKNKETGEYEYLIIPAQQVAFKVVFYDDCNDAPSDAYINEETNEAFVLESVKWENYEIANRTL